MAMQRLLNPVPYTENDLVFHDELFHSFDHHGSFSKRSAEETLEGINANLAKAAEDIKNATVLFLTFGTSHIFRLIQNGEVVSNCHKLSGSYFDREVLKPLQIVGVLNDALEDLWKVNPNIKVVMTVSPVRYFAFGHYENSVSKAHLFTSVSELQEIFPAIYYFPAYELVMDDLRDYRFFSEDMLHPNYQATNYVWETLCNTMLEKKAIGLIKDVEEILMAVKHRPRNPDSEAHRKFVKKYLDKIEMMKQQHGFTFNDEEASLRRQVLTYQSNIKQKRT